MKIIYEKQKAINELQRISRRNTFDGNNEINEIVQDILQQVRIHGDLAVEQYTEKFDGFNPSPMQVSEEELKNAWNQTDHGSTEHYEIS